jgi:hypothetical protein
MRAADQWVELEHGLEKGWRGVRLSFAPEGPVGEAAAVLGPLQPGRVGDALVFDVPSSGGGLERLRNILSRLDRRRIWGTLAVVEVSAEPPATTPAPRPEAARHPTLTVAWDEARSELPPGWSDLLCELELDSSDHLPRAALLGAPLNPTRVPGESALRFRVSAEKGYGASPLMVRRCFERMDAEHIAGRIEVLVELSDTDNAVTQGPVWRLAGRSV